MGLLCVLACTAVVAVGGLFLRRSNVGVSASWGGASCAPPSPWGAALRGWSWSPVQSREGRGGGQQQGASWLRPPTARSQVHQSAACHPSHTPPEPKGGPGGAAPSGQPECLATAAARAWRALGGRPQGAGHDAGPRRRHPVQVRPGRGRPAGRAWARLTTALCPGWRRSAWPLASSSCCCCSASTACSARATTGSRAAGLAGGAAETCPVMTTATRRPRRRLCPWCCAGTSW